MELSRIKLNMNYTQINERMISVTILHDQNILIGNTLTSYCDKLLART